MKNANKHIKYENNMLIKYFQNFDMHHFLIEFNRFKPNFKNMRIGHSHKSLVPRYNRLVNVKLFAPVIDKVRNRKFVGVPQQAVIAYQIWASLATPNKFQ